MICLKSKNLLFIKPYKTAGTSVEIALSTQAGKADIVTPVGIADEFVRRSVNGQTPVNWAMDPDYEKCRDHFISSVFALLQEQGLTPSRENITSCKEKLLSASKPGQEQLLRQIVEAVRHRHPLPETRVFYNHIVPSEIIERLGKKNFESFSKVSIVRHPYEKLVSHAYWRAQFEGSFEQNVEFILNSDLHNEKFYFANGKNIIDGFIRFEFLQEDLQTIEKRFDLKLLSRLPVTKRRSAKQRLAARELLSTSQKKRCLEKNRWTFERFHYPTDL